MFFFSDHAKKIKAVHVELKYYFHSHQIKNKFHTLSHTNTGSLTLSAIQHTLLFVWTVLPRKVSGLDRTGRGSHYWCKRTPHTLLCWTVGTWCLSVRANWAQDRLLRLIAWISVFLHLNSRKHSMNIKEAQVPTII